MRGGRYEPQVGGHSAFMPSPLPPSAPHLEFDREMTRLLSDADRAVAELKGSTRPLPDTDLFVFMYVRKEAVLSSQIEGTQSSLDDVLRAEAQIFNPDAPKDVDEVLNYVAALNQGLERLSTMPISVRLIREIHARLMQDVRGGQKRPGEFRQSQVHIGPHGALVRDATYVPPPWQAVEEAMASLERFIAEDEDLPPLIRIGLAHAQFETIHPFLDGNGRTGRLLITFLLCKEGLLAQPVLYLSHYLRRHRSAYYDALQSTRDSGDFEGWLKFFLGGVAEVSREAADTAGKIITLREAHRELIMSRSERSGVQGLRLLESLFARPIVSINQISERLDLTYASALRLADRFTAWGLLIEITGNARNRLFEYRQYIDLFADR